MTDSEKATFRMSNRMIQTRYIRSIIYTHGLGVVGLDVVGLGVVGFAVVGLDVEGLGVVGGGEGGGYGSKIRQTNKCAS